MMIATWLSPMSRQQLPCVGRQRRLRSPQTMQKRLHNNDRTDSFTSSCADAGGSKVGQHFHTIIPDNCRESTAQSESVRCTLLSSSNRGGNVNDHSVTKFTPSSIMTTYQSFNSSPSRSCACQRTVTDERFGRLFKRKTTHPDSFNCDIRTALPDPLRRVRRRHRRNHSHLQCQTKNYLSISYIGLILLLLTQILFDSTKATTSETRRSGKVLLPTGGSEMGWQLDNKDSALVLPSAPLLSDYRFYDNQQQQPASLSPTSDDSTDFHVQQSVANSRYQTHRYHQSNNNNYSPYAENAGIAYKLPFMSSTSSAGRGASFSHPSSLQRRENLTPNTATNYNFPPAHHRNRHRLQTRQLYPVNRHRESFYNPLPSPPTQLLIRQPYENTEQVSWQQPPAQYENRPQNDDHRYDITFESSNNVDLSNNNDLLGLNRNRPDSDQLPSLSYVLEKRRSQFRLPGNDYQDQRRERPPQNVLPRPLTPSQRRKLIRQQFIKFRHHRPSTTTTTTAAPVGENPDFQQLMESAQVYDENFATNTIAPPPLDTTTTVPVTTSAKSDLEIKVMLSEFYNRFSTTTLSPTQQSNNILPSTVLHVCQLDEQCVYARDCADIDDASSSLSPSSRRHSTARSCTIVNRTSFGQIITHVGGICCPIRIGDDILSPISPAITSTTISTTLPPSPPPPLLPPIQFFSLPSTSPPVPLPPLPRPQNEEINQIAHSAAPSPDYESEDTTTINARRAVINVLSKRRVQKNWYAQTLDKYYTWLKNKWHGGGSATDSGTTTSASSSVAPAPVETTFGVDTAVEPQQQQQQNTLTPPSSSSGGPSLLQTIQKAYQTYLVSHPSSTASGVQPQQQQEPVRPPKGKAVNSQYVCGERKFLRSPRILGGRETLFGEWPWTAIVNVFGKQRCGGALVNERFIVTAAHCLYYFSLLSWFPGLSVVLGEHNRNDETRNPLPARSNEVEAVYLHPDYVHKTKSHDVALIKLKAPIEFVDNIQPVCLPTREYPDRYATVMGWGKRSYSDTIDDLPDSPYQVDLQIHSRADCISMLRKSGAHLQGGYGEEFSCAGGEAGKDACRGDSGGPLMIQNNESGQFELVGLVSKGFGCGEAGIPGIYTNLLSLRGWIEQTVHNNS